MEWTEIVYVGREGERAGTFAFDHRAKLLFLAGAIVLVLLSKRPWVPLYFLGLSAAILVRVRASLRQFLVRLTAPFLVVGTLIVIQAFAYGSTPLAEFPVFGHRLVLYREGFYRGIQLGLRVAGGVSVMILISLTSSILEILASLKYFGVPRAWLEIAFLSYRYLFVFVQHLLRGYQSQRTRLGYRSLRSGLKSSGVLVGNLVLSVFDQTSRTYDAMRARAYRGDFPVPETARRIDRTDLLLVLAGLVPGGLLLWV